jgi:uncharacterized protein YkwD
MTSDSNTDGDIDPERRTAIKSIGIFGTAFTGLYRKDEDALSSSDHVKDQLWEKVLSDRGYGYGKWCWSQEKGKGEGHDRGDGYDRDYPHFADDNRWHEKKEWRDKDGKKDLDEDLEEKEKKDDDPKKTPDEDPEDPDADPEEGLGPFEAPEQVPDEDPDDPDDPDDDPEQVPDEDPEETPDEPDEDPEDPDEEPDEDPDEIDTPSDVVTQIEMRIHEEVNEYREANSLDLLTFDDELAAVARDHSQDMNDRDYFSHFSPEGDGPGDRLDEAGIDCDSWAENIAFEYDPSFSEEDADSVAESIVDGWISSPGHRENLLGDYDDQGIGVDIRDDGQVMATQIFCSSN